MKTVSFDYVQELIDFAPSEHAKQMGFAEAQLHGCVAAFNMLTRNRVAYIADEVGMGKTYVALGVMGLLRYQQPGARIVVVAPRENIQLKWIKELRNFVHDNWLLEDNRFRNLYNEPVRPPVACGSFDELADRLRLNDNCDLFLRSTTFSIATKQAKARARYRKRLYPYVPWIDQRLLRTRDPSTFRDMFGRVLNAMIPEIDLLVIDEAHNFKHGFGEKVSNRNRVMGLCMGHPSGGLPECSWYGHRVKRVLMLSATPFEYDYADLYRQLDVFGFGDIRLADETGSNKMRVDQLLGDDEDLKRELLKRFLIRRVQYLKIGGKQHSKNMYRREWRQGGYANHDEPMALTDPRQRLVVGLIQKKVAEILGDRKFNNSFQIGMLSSFESFLESMVRSKRLNLVQAVSPEPGENGEEEDDAVGPPTFDGHQEATRVERKGIDTHSLEEVVKSYRDRFGRGLPHPKLDATADNLASCFQTGDKVLIFVRRVATVSELKAKLDAHYDRWIQRRMERALPELHDEIVEIFQRYHNEKRGLPSKSDNPDLVDEQETKAEELAYDLEEDVGGTESFFAWFFRGAAAKETGILTGAAFQKNRLASVGSAYAAMFEDDYVSWLLGRPVDVVGSLVDHIGLDPDAIRDRLRSMAYGYFTKRTKRRESYPRLYVHEAYQFAALRLLAETGSEGTSEGHDTSPSPSWGGTKGGGLPQQAADILHERFPDGSLAEITPPTGFPDPEGFLGSKTLFTALVKRDELRQAIWPAEDSTPSFREQFRRRELRRELISAMARLGAAYVDLYLLAIRQLGSFDLRGEQQPERPEQQLIDDFLNLLEDQMRTPHDQQAFNALRELSEAAKAFDTLMAVNFPEARDAPIPDFATIFGRALQRQSPVGRMSGGVNKRLVKQFRMPGYPLVLPTTDVLQEGEDLHTFCRNVIHYGISWTPSAMEQRTGRVDRIGSLVQRRLDGSDRHPAPHELLQVYYPHLTDTVERLQVRRVLARLNKFLRLVHRSVPTDTARNSRVNIQHEILRPDDLVPPIEELLESDFPVTEGWRSGELAAASVQRPDIQALETGFQSLCCQLEECLGAFSMDTRRPRRAFGVLAVKDGQIISREACETQPGYRRQLFQLELRSQRVGDATLIRCISPIGLLDLRDSDVLDRLYELQRDLGMVRVCTRFDRKHHKHSTTIEGDRLFYLKTLQFEELERLVTRTVLTADRVEYELLGEDASPEEQIAAGERDEDYEEA